MKSLLTLSLLIALSVAEPEAVSAQDDNAVQKDNAAQNDNSGQEDNAAQNDNAVQGDNASPDDSAVQEDAAENLDADSILHVDVRDLPPTAQPACFSARSARSFDAISDRYVYLRALRDEHYLLTIFPGCIGLRGSFGIAVSSSFDRVCANDLASIVYRRFDHAEFCRIVNVESVSSKQAAEEIAETRGR